MTNSRVPLSKLRRQLSPKPHRVQLEGRQDLTANIYEVVMPRFLEVGLEWRAGTGLKLEYACDGYLVLWIVVSFYHCRRKIRMVFSRSEQVFGNKEDLRPGMISQV